MRILNGWTTKLMQFFKKKKKLLQFQIIALMTNRQFILGYYLQEIQEIIMNLIIY